MTMIIHVAVAILQRKNEDGHNQFLLASRPEGKGWAGWWEFPGGKIEDGEAPEHALARELAEELGIKPTITQQWLTRQYDYPALSQNGHDTPAKTVLLHFYFVSAWQGEVSPLEGQQLSWQSADNLTVAPILPANAPIMKALELPPVYAISNIAEMGENPYLDALQSALNKGLRLIQVREKQLAKDEFVRVAAQIIALAKPYNATVLISQDIALARDLGAHGVHLPSQSLLMLRTKPEGLMVTASCHNEAELAHAEMLGLDFVVLSPVKSTQSHPEMDAMGWQTFAEMAQKITLPVYALGGMTLTDLPIALSYGARGIAYKRGISSHITD
jgi:8-oxo-dGTP diphosphatase